MRTRRCLGTFMVLGGILFPGTVLLALPRVSLAGQTVYTTVQEAFPLEDQGHSARASALGSAYSAVGGDGDGLYYNPAGLASVLYPQASLSHQDWIGGISQETLWGAFPISPDSAFAIGADYLGFGSLQGYSASGDPTGPYSPSRTSLALGGGVRVFPQLLIGLSTEESFQAISSSSSTYSSFLCAGVLWKTLPGFQVGSYYSFSLTDSPLGYGLWKMGAAWLTSLGMSKPARLLLDLSMPPFGVYNLQAGVEQPLGGIVLRLGYQAALKDNQIEGFQGLTAGLGVRLDGWGLDYSYAPYGDLGYSQMFALTWQFSSDSRPGGTPHPSPTPAPHAGLSPLPTFTSTPVNRETAPAAGSPTALAPTLATPSTTPTATQNSSPVSASPTPSSLPAVNFNPPTHLSAQDKLNQVEVQFDLPDQGAQIPTGPLPAGLKQDIDDQAAKVQENPSDALAWKTLGGLYWRAGRADYTLQSFEEALRLRPFDAPLRTWVEKYHSLHSPTPTPGP